MFPIIVTIVAGVQNIKPILLTSARSMGASRWQILRWVIFPHMIPSFFAGMRLGMSGVLLGVLLAELYVSTAGIGHFTTMFTENFDPTKLFGLIAMLAAMAIVLNEIVRRAETTVQPLALGGKSLRDRNDLRSDLSALRAACEATRARPKQTRGIKCGAAVGFSPHFCHNHTLPITSCRRMIVTFLAILYCSLTSAIAPCRRFNGQQP